MVLSVLFHSLLALAVVDAACDTIYRMVPLEYELENEAAAGQPGV